jgi:hypothetical protein
LTHARCPSLSLSFSLPALVALLAVVGFSLGMAAPASAQQLYLWADQPAAADYAPSAAYAGMLGSSTELAPRIRRSGPGAYAVDLGGAMFATPGGNVQVSAYDAEGKYCNVLSWSSGVVNVRCFGAGGAAADSRFTLLATTGRASGLAYAWVDTRSGASVSAQYAQSEGGAVTASVSGVGNYVVSLPGALADGGNVMVTAYGSGAGYCNVGSWSAGRAVVRCYSPGGSPANSSFTLLATDARYEPASGAFSYLWGNDAHAATYTPSPGYAHTPDATPSVRRRASGHYEVSIGGLVSGGGGVQVTAYGSAARCAPTGWGGGKAVVRCFGADGSPVDSRFSLLAVRSGGSGGGTLIPNTVIGGEAPRILTAPVIHQRLNVVEHLCINTICETGDESWDKTPAERDFDGTETSTFEVDVDGSRLVRLCPVRARTTDREFGGNGPEIRARSEITQEDQTLRLSAFMSAEETGRGSSRASKGWEGLLYTAPAGWRITNFEPKRSETSYTDTNHEEDAPPVRGGSLVSSFRFKGDTGGDDIGNCTEDDTYMTVAYNPVTVTLQAVRSDLREVRIRRGVWMLGLRAPIQRLRITINNYDRTASQPENGVAENRYFVDRTDRSAWPSLTEAQVRAGSFFEYRADGDSPGVAPTPLPVPAVRRNTFTFLLNDITSTGRSNSVDPPAGDYIRFTLRFESAEPEVVAACVNNVVCGTGEPHEAGKPLVQVDNLEILPYLRPRVERVGGAVTVHADLTRVRMEADIHRDGVCRDNAFAWACSAFAGNIEKIAYDAVLEQLDAFVRGSRPLLDLLDTQFTQSVCGLLRSQGEDCDDLENIVLDENGDMLLFLRR